MPRLPLPWAVPLRGDSEALALLGLQERIVLEELGGNARIVKELGDGPLPGRRPRPPAATAHAMTMNAAS